MSERTGETEYRDREANEFALCLLMPEKLIRENARPSENGAFTFEEIERLANLFKVPEAAMTLRLKDLYGRKK